MPAVPTPDGPGPGRRADLTEHATDHVLEHGLIGLSLRPLAQALGTSDRMLLYHFGSKADLVAAVLVASNDRSVATLEQMPPGDDVARSVHELWQALLGSRLEQCQRVYVEASALGLFGLEPYASAVRAANERWLAALSRRLEAAGCRPDRARRAAELVESVTVGLLLDRPLSPDGAEQEQVVADLAAAVAAMA